MSTTTPITTTVGENLYDALAPLAYADPELGWPLATYCDALALMLEQTALLVRTDDQGNDGWSAFADPQRCPDEYLYTLALWAGIRYPRRMAASDLRQVIGPHAPGLWRGTRAALLATVQRYVIPGGQLYFEERADGNPYLLRIYTYAYDTLDETALHNELLGQIPAGLILDYQLRQGQNYRIVRDSVADYAALLARWGTYDSLHHGLP